MLNENDCNKMLNEFNAKLEIAYKIGMFERPSRPKCMQCGGDYLSCNFNAETWVCSEWQRRLELTNAK